MITMNHPFFFFRCCALELNNCIASAGGIRRLPPSEQNAWGYEYVYFGGESIRLKRRRPRLVHAHYPAFTHPQTFMLILGIRLKFSHVHHGTMRNFLWSGSTTCFQYFISPWMGVLFGVVLRHRPPRVCKVYLPAVRLLLCGKESDGFTLFQP